MSWDLGDQEGETEPLGQDSQKGPERRLWGQTPGWGSLLGLMETAEGCYLFLLILDSSPG